MPASALSHPDRSLLASLLRRHRVVGELQVPVLSAGGTAFVAIDDFEKIPVQAGLIRPEPLHQFRDVERRLPLAGQAVDRQACAGLQLLSPMYLR